MQIPDYDLSKSVNIHDSIVLSIWARGKNGGETVKFIVGGINNATLPNRDSFGSFSTGAISLKTDWQEYILNLTGKELRMLIGGFCRVTDYTQSPNGVTFYLDDSIIKKIYK